MVRRMDVLRSIKTAHLELILKIVETEKLQRAAEAMAMSQPAASRILSQLEAAIGSPLFARHPRGMVPTVVGAAVARHARVILSELDTLVREVGHLRSGLAGEVRVGTVTGPAVGCLMPAVQALLRDAPDLDISVEVAPSSTLVQGLEVGRFDFILGRLPPGQDNRDLRLYPARTEVVTLLVHRSHPLARKGRTELSETADYPWVMQATGMPIRQAIDEAFRLAGLSPPGRVLNSSSLLVALSQLIGGEAIAPQSEEVSRLLMRPEIGDGFAVLDLDRRIVVPPYYIVRNRYRQLSPASERLLEETLDRI